MVRLRFSIILSIVSFVTAAPAIAEDTALPPSDNAEDIVVTANRAPERLSRIGQSVTVIDAETLKTRQTAILTDILREVPGLSVARNGGVGGTTSVFIRGAESAQTVALIDGVKLNDPSSPGGGGRSRTTPPCTAWASHRASWRAEVSSPKHFATRGGSVSERVVTLVVVVGLVTGHLPLVSGGRHGRDVASLAENKLPPPSIGWYASRGTWPHR